jgi:hypothetical protein
MGRTPLHLAQRFFEVLLAKPLTVEESDLVESWVDPALWVLFTAQQAADQRHGYNAALKVAGAGGSSELVVAALMHDVGKSRSRLGVLGRTWATVLMALGAPMSGRLSRYRDHGELGAMDLEQVGAPVVAVLFARHHQWERPDGIGPDDWSKLIWADEPGIPEQAKPGR